MAVRFGGLSSFMCDARLPASLHRRPGRVALCVAVRSGLCRLFYLREDNGPRLLPESSARLCQRLVAFRHIPCLSALAQSEPGRVAGLDGPWRHFRDRLFTRADLRTPLSEDFPLRSIWSTVRRMKDELIIAARFLKAEEAEVSQGLLQSEGIESFVADELTQNVYSGITGASGGVRLMVRKEDLPRAQKVLEKVGCGSIALPDDFEPPADEEPPQGFPVEGYPAFLAAFLKGGLIGLGIFGLLAGGLLLLGFPGRLIPGLLAFIFFLGGLLGLFCLPGGVRKTK
ncbi:MAG TPA: hypothetical protein DCZ95_00525 [Verrucomicrobia bacterium]|nr:hypothetical protein [Verrucomicrobiota bacterium]